MPSLGKPSHDVLCHFLAEQSEREFSYLDVGATATSPPVGFVADQTRIRLGEGESTFRKAIAALQGWKHFQLGWVDAWPLETPIKPDETVVVMGRALGLWWLNSCRVIYVVDESGPICRFGFAYGTLPKHIEKGEERFLIEWDQHDNGVWYDILAVSVIPWSDECKSNSDAIQQRPFSGRSTSLIQSLKSAKARIGDKRWRQIKY